MRNSHPAGAPSPSLPATRHFLCDQPVGSSALAQPHGRRTPPHGALGVRVGGSVYCSLLLKFIAQKYLLTRNLAMLRGHQPVYPKVTCLGKH